MFDDPVHDLLTSAMQANFFCGPRHDFHFFFARMISEITSVSTVKEEGLRDIDQVMEFLG